MTSEQNGGKHDIWYGHGGEVNVTARKAASCGERHRVPGSAAIIRPFKLVVIDFAHAAGRARKRHDAGIRPVAIDRIYPRIDVTHRRGWRTDVAADGAGILEPAGAEALLSGNQKPPPT